MLWEIKSQHRFTSGSINEGEAENPFCHGLELLADVCKFKILFLTRKIKGKYESSKGKWRIKFRRNIYIFGEEACSV